MLSALLGAGIDAKQVRIVDYDSERGYNPRPHPRGDEVFILVRRTTFIERSHS